MYRCKWKVLIAAFFVAVCILTSITAGSRNGSTYYLRQPPNTTLEAPPTTAHHYAIVNSTKTILAAAVHRAKLLTPSYENHLERSSVIYGLTKVANESVLNPTCHLEMKRIQWGIMRKEPWAMKVLDASGTKPSGFVFGQNFWLGSREACGAVQNPVAITLSKNYQRVMHFSLINEQAPFDMNYRVIYLRHNSPWQVEIKLMSEQIIHIGLCLPQSCSSNEIKKLTEHYVERGLFVENDIYDIRPTVVYMKDLTLKESFYQKPSFRMTVTLMIFTCAMMFAAMIMRERPLVESETEPEKAKLQPAFVSSGIGSQEGFFGRIKDFIRCYDIQANYDKLFATRESTANEIPVINGLRSICALWIMLFHVMWFMYFTVNNKAFLISYAEQVFFQFVSSAPLLVDVFFTISGFLQTYNFIRNTKQIDVIQKNTLKQNAQLFFKMLFHRYLRLGPLYFVVMGVVDLVYSYIGDVSLYHINERFDEICSRQWWRNVLFIQNFFDHNDMCLNWSWSLACEMQYFILATILLFIYAKHPKLVKSLVALTFVANIWWSFTIGFQSKFQLSFDVAFATGTEIYISPFVRVLPYLLGSLAGWYMHEHRGEFDISDGNEKRFWHLAILIFFLCIYSTIKRDMSVFLSISLFVIGRFFFSLSICWMIVGSATGRGTWWSRMLEARVFQHINRLSYAIYLLNPFVIALLFSLTSTSTHADPLMLCVLSTGFTVIIYLLAIVFSVAFEMPYCNWSSVLLKRQKSKSA